MITSSPSRTLVRPLPEVCPRSLHHRRMPPAGFMSGRWAWPFHLRRHHQIATAPAGPPRVKNPGRLQQFGLQLGNLPGLFPVPGVSRVLAPN